MTVALCFPFQVRYTSTRILVTDSRKGFYAAVSDHPQTPDGLLAARFEADQRNAEFKREALSA